MPMLGETPEVKGLWSAAAVWVKEGPGVGKSRRRVDGARRVGDRPPRVRHRALPRAPEDPRARPRARRRGASTRPTASSTRASSGRPTATCGSRRCYERERGARRRLLRGRRLGAPAVVSSPTRRSSRSTASQRARGRVGLALVVADHQRRAPRDARARRRSSTCPRSRSSTSPAPARSTSLQRVAMRQMDVAVGRVVYTPLLTPGGGFQLRPHDHAPRRRPLPRRHRRRARHGRPQVVRRPPARGRLGAARRRHDGLDARSACGGRGPATSSQSVTARRRLARGLPVRHLPDDRDRLAARARLAHLVRRRPRLGALRRRSSRARACGTCSGEAGAAARRSSPCGIGVYGTTGRLEKCYRAYGAELECEYDVVEAGMAGRKRQGAGLRRQGGAPAPPRGRARRRSSAR